MFGDIAVKNTDVATAPMEPTEGRKSNMIVPESEQICYPKICLFGIKDYFKLKAIKTQQIQEKLLTSLLNCLNLLWKWGLYQENSYYQIPFICITKQLLFSKNILWPSCQRPSSPLYLSPDSYPFP